MKKKMMLCGSAAPKSSLVKKPFASAAPERRMRCAVRCEKMECEMDDDVAGEALQKGLKGFIYGERGVWRPGDNLYLSFIFNDAAIKYVFVSGQDILDKVNNEWCNQNNGEQRQIFLDSFRKLYGCHVWKVIVC